MARRHISLYYASIGWASALRHWAASGTAASSGHVFRERLHEAISTDFAGRAAFALGSGRGALATVLRAAGVGLGAKVVLSSYTCLAVPTAVVSVGATPVYVDIDPATLNMTASDTIQALGPGVRAVVVQHTLGKSAPIETIAASARERGILVIEDCALAMGSTIHGRQLGTFGDAAIFSMELSKTLSCGWGGILLVNDDALAGHVAAVFSSLPEQSWWSSTRDAWQTAISAWCHEPETPEAVRRWIFRLAFKSRLFRPSTPAGEFDGLISPEFARKMGTAQAAFALSQWSRRASIERACAANCATLRRALTELGLAVPGAPSVGEVSLAPRVSWLVTDREMAIRYFRDRGIELGRWFDGPLSPIPTDQAFNYSVDGFPRARRIARTVVNLPSHDRLDEGDLDRIVTVLRDFVREHPNCAIEAGQLRGTIA